MGKLLETIRRGERGQDVVEYAGVLVVVALLLLAVASFSGLGAMLRSGISTEICRIFNGGCGSGATGGGVQVSHGGTNAPGPAPARRSGATGGGLPVNHAGAKPVRAQMARAGQPTATAQSDPISQIVNQLVHGIKSALQSVVHAISHLVSEVIQGIKDLLHPKPPPISPNNPQVKAILAFIQQFAVQAAVADGARDDAEAKSFILANKNAIANAAKLYATRAINRTGAFLLARGVENEQLTNLIISLYRPGATIGDGSTMDALESEVQNGVKVDGRYPHLIKATEARTALIGSKTNPGILSQNLTPSERKVAGYLVQRLNKVIAYAQSKP